MADIINLRRARKAKARAGAQIAAAANRTKFGLTKRARDQADGQRDRAARKLDGHRLTSPGED